MKKVLFLFILCPMLLFYTAAPAFSTEAHWLPHRFVSIVYDVPENFVAFEEMAEGLPVRRHQALESDGIEAFFSVLPLPSRLTNKKTAAAALLQKIAEGALASDTLQLRGEPEWLQIGQRLALRIRYTLQMGDGAVYEDSLALLHDGYLYTLTCRSEAAQEGVLAPFADHLFYSVYPVSFEDDEGM